MMKRVFKIGLMVSLLVASTSLFAQEDKPEYPRYGFWSNWSLGGSLDFDHQFPMGNSWFGDGAGFGRTVNLGFDFFAQKKVNHMFDVRIRIGLPCLIPAADVVATPKGNYVMSNHGSFTADFMFSINNAIMGYNPERKWSVYVFAGAGVGLSLNKFYRNRFIKWGAAGSVHPDFNYGIYGVTLDGGVGFSFACGEHNNFFIEYGMDWDGDLPMPFSGDLHHTNGIIRLGYFYNFGPTEEDQALIDQRAALTFSNMRKLRNQVADLEDQVANSRNNEKKLENRISDLESQLADARAHQGTTVQQKAVNSAAADSLQAVIDKIKADQLNFYAMPFSVQYDVNEWKVSEQEAEKVKAVANILKNNSDMKIFVAGYADYSGSDNYNMKLSEKRANEVKRMLVKQYGIAEDRIEVKYYGKSVSFGDVKYAINRRVSFYRVID